MAVSIAMVTSLALYGARSLARPPQVAGPSGASHGAQSVRLGTAKLDLPLTDREQESLRRELSVASTLGLTKDQMGRFVALKHQAFAETRVMMSLGAAAADRGVLINQWWNAGLRSIFTKEQYAGYCAGFTPGGIPLVGPEARQAGRTFTSQAAADSFYGSQEERILQSLGLNLKQWRQVRELYAELAKDNQELRQLWQGSDSMAIGRKGSEINAKQNTRMKAILTPKQHAKYLELWGVNKRIVPDGRVYSPARAMPRGAQQ
jgi:hypothetical protein